MNKYVKFGIAIVAFIGLMVGVYVLYQTLAKDYKPEQNLVVENNEETSSEEKTETQGQAPEDTQTIMAVDFTMTNAAGEEVNLFDFKGKPIVLNFWASWCGPCKAEIPDFQAAYEQYGENVEFILLNMTDGQQETLDTAKKFIDREGYTLPFYFDTKQMQGAYTYGVNSLPTTFFVSAEGEMVAYATGMIDKETLEYGIAMIYSETR